ncbi:MAG: hypothetical protein ACLRID_08240 [Subdoligranulum sp.]|jgi:hypothetical protein
MVEMNMIKTAAASKKGQKASFAAFAARLNRSRFRPTRIFRSISVNNVISVSLSITFYEKQIEK